ncbi:MAG TPA: 50S ribosomal protein L17 [Candidatus Moranbacteria bacterium]|nr:50S ribosomal protein L17 [Candidatus Moranbacteria bacterium]
MRKRKKGRTLSRVSSQRKALLRTLFVSLIDNYQIKTTLAKARELRPFAERRITLAKRGLEKEDLISATRELKKDLPQKTVEKVILLANDFKNRAGGYLRIIKLSARKADSAEMAIVELVQVTKPKEERGDKGEKVKEADVAKKSKKKKE